jgi:hypothetical protein
MPLGIHALPASRETDEMRVAFLDHRHSEAGWDMKDCVLAAARLVDETIEVVGYAPAPTHPML